MDQRGRGEIVAALRNNGVEYISVTPKVKEGEDAPFVNIDAPEMAPAEVLNALDRAKLMDRGEDRPLDVRQDALSHPLLHILGISGGLLTFEDLHAGQNSSGEN